MDEVHVTGTIDADGRLTPGPWGAVPTVTEVAKDVDLGASAAWSVAALDKFGNVLRQVAASVAEVAVCPEGSRRDLSARVPLPPTVSAIVIFEGGREVFRRTVPEPSVVTLTGLTGHELRREQKQIKVQVNIHGPAPRPGAYLIPMWQSDNCPLVPLGLIDVGGGAPPIVGLNVAELPGGKKCRLLVTYGDGIRTVTAGSETISLEERPAIPVILAPVAGTRLLDSSWLVLEGRLDGDGETARLEWLLDGKLVAAGPRGGVARPPAGSHTLTLQYGTTRAAAEIVVTPAPVDELRQQVWAPPWRSRPFRSVNVVDAKE